MKVPSVGLIGCGRISAAYLRSLTQDFNGLLTVYACADLVRESAASRAQEFGVPHVLSVEELLNSPDVQIVANLTIPESHYQLNKAALLAGKHVYTEKPLALTTVQALELKQIAEASRLMLSCAPDTLLGAGLQASRKAIDDRRIGEPCIANASLSMHVPAPTYFRPGVGPTFDMGPYYIGAIASLLGPVKRISALGVRPSISRSHAKPPFIPETPARIAVALELHSGCIASLAICSDGLLYMPQLLIHGTAGTLTCGDPNAFGGEIVLSTSSGTEVVSGSFRFEENHRGIGMADMATALRDKRPHRLGADLAVHTVEVMEGILRAIETGVAQEMKTTCRRPPAMGPSSGDPFQFPEQGTSGK